MKRSDWPKAYKDCIVNGTIYSLIENQVGKWYRKNLKNEYPSKQIKVFIAMGFTCEQKEQKKKKKIA